MQIILQHATSGLYLKEPGVWTANLEAALNFGSSHRAIKFLKQQRLQGVQVVVAFVQNSYLDTVALQLPDYQPASPSKAA